LVDDDYGSITRGWVATGVYYASFVNGLSAGLGLAHVALLQQILSQRDSLTYFADTSALVHHDLLARSALVRLLLANRRKFSEVVMLTSSGRVTAAAEAFTAAVRGAVTLVRDVNEFDTLLRRVAPLAKQVLARKPGANTTPPRAARRP